MPPPRRPGAKAQSLRPCYAHVPNRKASRVCPGSLQARPRGCVLVNRYMKIETQLENRFERRCSGSSSPVYHGLSSTAPHLHLHHQPRHQPRVILQVCLAWHLLLAAAARTRLAPPLLRPPPSMSLVFAQKCLFPRWVCNRPSCLPCAPARGLRCFLSLGLVCHGVDRIWCVDMAQVSVHERIVSQPAGCERTDHGSEAGWGLACVFSRRIRKWFVWACWMGTQRRSRRDGGLACVLRRIRKWFVSACWM